MNATGPAPRWLKPVVDYGPLAVFLASYPTLGLMAATAALIAASLIALSLAWVLERRVPPVPLVTAAIVVVFGGLTVWLQDETFIKMKPTIVQAIFALVLLGGLACGRPLLKPLLAPMMPPRAIGRGGGSRCATGCSSAPWPRSTSWCGVPNRPTSG